MLLRQEGQVSAELRENGGYQRGRGENAHEGICPLGPVNLMQLLEHNLHLLPIGRALCDEMKALHNTDQPFIPFSPIEQRSRRTLAFFTSSGVSASKRCDILGVLGIMFNPLTLSIGVLTLRWDDSRAARRTDLNIQFGIYMLID